MEDLTEAYLSVYNDIEEAKTPVTRRSMGIESQFVDKTGEEKAKTKAQELSNSTNLADRKRAKTITRTIQTAADKEAAEAGVEARNRLLRRERDRVKVARNTHETFDLVLSHLLDEGYCDSQDSAIKMMAAMSQDWINAIVEEFVDPEHGETPSGRTPLENVANHPKKSVRKKAVAAFKDQMGKEYGGNWKSKSNDAR